MADRYPSEVEFYVPQLCTYLFHFAKDSPDGRESSFVLLEPPKPEGPGIEESKTASAATAGSESSNARRLLKDFLLYNSRKSMKFAHLVFWNLVAGIDDSDSIQIF